MEGRGYIWKLRGKLFVTIPIFLVLMIMPIGSGMYIDRAYMTVYLQSLNKIVEAPLVETFMGQGSDSSTADFNFYYEYTSDNGVLYRGRTADFYVIGYGKAQKVLKEGRTVKIYIDDYGNSVPVDDVIDPKYEIALCAGSASVAFLFALIFFIPHKVSIEKLNNKKIKKGTKAA